MACRACLAALQLVLLPSHLCLAQGNAAPSVLESWARATALIDSAIAAHGGMESIGAVRNLRVHIEGQDYHRNQGRRVAPPYDSTPRIIDMYTDLDRGRLVNQQTSGFPGGFVYTRRFVSDSARHYEIDVRNRTQAARQYPPAEQQIGNLFQVPQGYLQVASDPATSNMRRYLGRMRLSSGTVVEAVQVGMPNGQLTLGFDPATHRLVGASGVSPDVMAGDTHVDTEFHDYRMLSGVLLPARMVIRRAGEVIRELRYASAATGMGVPDSLLAPPASFGPAPAAPPVESVRTLAPGVWAIRGQGSSSLLIEFSDHLVAVDAPPSGAAIVLREARTLAPGKAVRFVVPTHHHDDHFGGVRNYAAAGATTVTTAGNTEYFRRLMAVPQSKLLRNQPQPTTDARLETIAGKRRVFSDGTRTVEIHDIGPSPHADEMLVAWLPSEGILFQGDLVEAPAAGIAQPGNNAETTMHLADFIWRQGWQVRVFAGAHAFLASPEEFEKLVRQPVHAPR